MQTSSRKLPLYRVLYIQVIIAIIFGILLGHFYPDVGESFKPLGDGFIKIVKNDHCTGYLLNCSNGYCRYE